MKVRDLIDALSLLDPEAELLVEGMPVHRHWMVVGVERADGVSLVHVEHADTLVIAPLEEHGKEE